MRLITVLMNEESSKIRNEETVKLLDYGFTNYKIKTVLSKDDELGTINIFNSKKEVYQLTLKDDATNLEQLNDNNVYNYNIKLNEVKAPIKSGDSVGIVDIISNNEVIKSVDITIKEDALKANIFDLILRNFKNIVIGNNVI